MNDEIQGSFQSRHIGPDAAARDAMLRTIGVPSIDTLIEQTIPSGIRLTGPLNLPEADTEAEYLRRLAEIASRNVPARSYIGMG
jgi:glycine dehydrogenase